MPNPKPFGHSFKLLLVSASAVMFAACSTTTPAPTQQRAPVAQRPAQPATPVVTAPTPDVEVDVKAPKEAEVKAPVIKDEAPKAPEEPVWVPAADAGPYFNNREGLTPPHMTGRNTKRLAILLPFSTSSSRLAQEAQSMYRAAEMAIFDRNETDVLLFALDTKGTEAGAKSATKAAIKAGADVILGPILAGNVKAAAKEARRSQTPLLAFSTDQTVAGNGTYLMSFPPEAEVARVVDYVSGTGTTRFAYLGPDSAYGRRVKSAFDNRVQGNYGEVTAAETYQGSDITVMQAPAQRLANFHAKGEEAAKANGGTTPMSFEAILLPEGGTALRKSRFSMPMTELTAKRRQHSQASPMML